ncbi:hypothetical protein [Phycicoccus sp. 3266]|jgi:hypothetical protein|uniref:hypothetical protein n=1 Tax=Phycicoccus sp. 3266 TaxID=2817751 RepID=UPI00285C5DFA|nr:hypothetical protein [Phycicoccus sp. 3266]MDR6864124.1 hypothetical protein [Phycicoccus sp. 3266]
MKAITTLFESILTNEEAIVWSPAEGPTQFSRGWGWGGVDAAARGWGWGGADSI